MHLVAHKGIQPEQLLVATFTEKAANELTSRIARRLMQEGVQVNVDEMYAVNNSDYNLIISNTQKILLKRKSKAPSSAEQLFLMTGEDVQAPILCPSDRWGIV